MSRGRAFKRCLAAKTRIISVVRANSMRNVISQAIMMSDDWVVEFCYRDSKGNESIRVVSPVRFLGSDRFLGLCLSREEPRQFYLNRCTDLTIRPAHDYVMPVPIRQLAVAG